MSEDEITCVTEVLLTYVKPSDLADYVAGSRTFAQLRTSSEAKTQSGVNGCLGK